MASAAGAETKLESRDMRQRAFIIAIGLLAVAGSVPAFAAGDDASSAPAISCGNGIPGGVNCVVSKKDLKEARKAFERGVKFQDQRRPEEAFARFDEATRLAPQNIQFLTAREVVKAQLVFNHIEQGNLLLLQDAARTANTATPATAAKRLVRVNRWGR